MKEVFRSYVMLQKSAAMTAISVCLFLVVVTAHTSLAKVFTQCEAMAVLKKQEVPENDLATCEFNALEF
jgi:4-hydroxy-L-threonine phosphate dehydrogenase PdxA